MSSLSVACLLSALIVLGVLCRPDAAAPRTEVPASTVRVRVRVESLSLPVSARSPADTSTILAKAKPDSLEAMAAHALGLPAGPDRDTAFTEAVNRWILSDPSAVAAWSLRLTTPREFDQVAALLVIHTDTLHRPTALALEWAEDLADPVLRRRALVHVLREWAQADHDAALHYAESSPSLTSEQRAAVLAALTPYLTET